MVNKQFSVKDSVKNLELDAISTNGYEFIWDVALNGYEWLGKDTLLFDKEFTRSRFFELYVPDIVMNPRESRYNKDTILYAATLNRNTYSMQEVHPDSIDREPPWLVGKGELELAQRQLAAKVRMKDWKGTPTRQYNPLSIRTLHRQFAGLNIENLETEIPKFANYYGLLGQTVHLNTRTRQAPATVQGESVHRWETEIERMGVLLAIWDLILWQDHDKLAQLFIWHYNSDYVEVRLKWQHQEGEYKISRWEGKEKVPGFGHYGELVALRWMSPGFFSEYKRGSPIGPAWFWLGSKLNAYLYGIHPKLTGYQQPKVIHIPRTLLDALWLLFMLEVQGKVKVTRCLQCGKWFEWERNTKTYCSPNCRSLDFYHRRKLKEAQNERKHKTEKQE
jgi:endogenous inhibitor of DNA gyrase (YacG/DUF329 family)